MRCGERTQAAIPHLPRIRMNACGEASAKTGILPRRALLFDLDVATEQVVQTNCGWEEELGRPAKGPAAPVFLEASCPSGV